MSNYSNDLFVWKGHKSRLNEEIEIDDNLSRWRSKTAKAADKAANYVALNGQSKQIATPTLIDEDIYTEAKSLVKNWMTDKKVYGEYSSRQSFLELSSDDFCFSPPTRIEVHREWEHLVEKIETKEDFKDELESYLSKDDFDLKNDKKLKTIMSNLQKKTFVDPSKLKKIDSSKSIDMKKRIENRQDEVKKKREERLKKEEILKLEKLAEKEAKIEAIKMLKEEKKLKELSIKKEEELLQIEMNKIRQELQKKREQEMLEMKRLKEAQELLAKQQKQKNSSNKLKETSQIIESQIAKTVSDRYEIIAEFVEKKFLNKNRQLTQKCFQAWRNELMNTQIKIEKAKVWFEWKLSRKIFRSWYQFSRTNKINLQINIDQQRIKSMQMKECKAVDFWKRNLLKKCIINWSLFVIDEKEIRWCQKLEDMRKKKMMKYVETLQEKILENQEKIEKLSLEACCKAKSEENEIEQPIMHNITVETERLGYREERVLANNFPCQTARQLTVNKKPKEAWQITKKDVYLPLEKLVDDPNKRDLNDQQIKCLKKPKIFNNYAYRDAAQKEMIKQQQLKIREQQRLIDEIKSKKLLKEIKQDQNDAHSDPRPNNQQTPVTINENELPMYSQDNSSRNKNKFILHMEARAKEREKIKAERLERQKKIDEEKKKILEERIAEQSKIEHEEKLKREKMLKEKKEKERLKEEARQKRNKWEQETNQQADEFYKKLLLKHFGIKTWIRFVQIQNQNVVKADNHYSMVVKRKVFTFWLNDVQKQNLHQTQLVHKFYSQILLRRCFHHIKLFKHRYDLMDQLAEDHYCTNLMKKYFREWRLINHRQQMRLDRLEVQSECHYKRSLVKKIFLIWKELPMEKRLEREKERRKDAMRQKVASIIPDFKPKHFDKL